MHVPFAERGGALRGLLDVATGCYPAFLFGGSIGAQIPVFHFHAEAQAWLEPRLQHLADNGYRTIACDEIARFVIDGVSPGPRAVALTFDDAWASVWSVAYPLLKQYGLRATVFAIPGRIDARPDAPKPHGEAGPHQPPAPSEFVSWEQLRTMQASGVVDVQSHTQWHVMMFSEPAIVGFVTPAFGDESPLNRPVMSEHTDDVPRFLETGALGAPLFVRRSRMSDARRFIPDPDVETRCRDLVARGGGAAFFARPRWRSELETAAGSPSGRHETDDQRRSTIRAELANGRELLNAHLGVTSVRHVALPWGIAGDITRGLLAETGHTTAFAERPLKRRGVHAGDDRFQLMRLNGKFVGCLPGRHRQWFFTTVR